MEPLRPFKPFPPTPEKIAELKAWAAKHGQDPDAVDKSFEEDMRGKWFGNEEYVVIKSDIESPEGWPPMCWLSIRRQDRGPIKSWRDFQAIKDQLVGPECEGVELYPAASRVVDTANQYHLWCFTEPGFFPLGFGEGLRTDESVGGAVQEPGA